MIRKALLLIVLYLISWSNVSAQNKVPRPKFDTFKGSVYSMRVMEVMKGKARVKGLQQHYGDNVFDYNKITEIELAEINIPETQIGEGKFPGVEKTSQFCMVLYSTMEIELEGCYEFSLNSDDGSTLWIEDEIALNNDGGHQMKLKKDTIGLTKGKYDIKLWYFQGLPDKFGFQFNSKLVGKLPSCEQREVTKEIEIPSYLLFESGAYQLTDQANNELSIIADLIHQKQLQSIEIIGHTDNKGTPKSNMTLSIRRAEHVLARLQELVGDASITFIALGRGEEEPKTSNDSEEGRSDNRRVQIILNH